MSPRSMRATLPRRFRSLATLLPLLTPLPACEGDSAAPVRIDGVRILSDTVRLAVGERVDVDVSVRFMGGTLPSVEVAWSTVDTTVARVDGVGGVLGMGPGETVLAAEAGGHRDEAVVLVVHAAAATVAIAQDSLMLVEGLGAGLTVTATDALQRQVPASSIRWLSGDVQVAVVDSLGVVTALRAGEAWIHGEGTLTSDSALVRVEPGYAAVAPGATHACAVRAGASPFCWGDLLEDGVAARGSFETETGVVHPRSTDTARRFTRLVSGEAFTCGLLRDDGLFCWGRAGEGQHGSGGVDGSASPRAAAGGRRFLSVAAGTAHVCGVDSAGGLWCWGRATDGQVGAPASAPALSAMRVLDGEDFALVAAGARHACAVGHPQAVAWCWGANDAGQLGRDTGGAPGTPARVSGSLRLTALGAAENATCGVTGAGELWCWGALGGAQPTRIESPAALVSLSTGGLGRHMCGLDADGRAFCWGAGGAGQLGDGAGVDRSVPTPVAGQARFQTLAVGPRSTCGVTLGKRLLCWGTGSLGAGADVQRSDVPVAVAEPREGAAACPDGGCLP